MTDKFLDALKKNIDLLETVTEEGYSTFGDGYELGILDGYKTILELYLKINSENCK